MNLRQFLLGALNFVSINFNTGQVGKRRAQRFDIRRGLPRVGLQDKDQEQSATRSSQSRSNSARPVRQAFPHSRHDDHGLC